MDELVELVSEKTGISEEQAKQAVETVIAYLKDKLPKPIAGQIDKALSGGGVDVEDLTEGLGGMLGGN
jgi:ribosomal protein L7/L12